MRVIVSALAICAASFLAGVAGDLSSASARQEAPARPQVVQLPPMQYPQVDLTNAVRAHPLPLRHAVQRAEPAAHAAPAAFILEPTPLTPLSDESVIETLAGGPDSALSDSALAPAVPAISPKHVAKPNPVLAGKAAEERASKA